MARATYTPEDKARVYVTLTTNDGNIKRTARDMGVPENTIRRWRDEWAKNGPPELEQVERAVGEFLDEAVELRGLALQALRRKVDLLLKDPDKVKVAELTTLMGVLDDKITRAQGLATGRVEHVHTLPPADEIREALVSAFGGMKAITEQREAEVIEDADYSVAEQTALPSGEQA